MKTLSALLVMLMFSQAASATTRKPTDYANEFAPKGAVMYMLAYYHALTAAYQIRLQTKEVCRWEDDGVEHCYETVSE